MPRSRWTAANSRSSSSCSRGSTPATGSSRATRSGFRTRARAIASRCCWPPDIWRGCGPGTPPAAAPPGPGRPPDACVAVRKAVGADEVVQLCAHGLLHVQRGPRDPAAPSADGAVSACGPGAGRPAPGRDRAPAGWAGAGRPPPPAWSSPRRPAHQPQGFPPVDGEADAVHGPHRPGAPQAEGAGRIGAAQHDDVLEPQSRFGHPPTRPGRGRGRPVTTTTSAECPSAASRSRR